MLEKYWELRKKFFDLAMEAEEAYIELMKIKKLLGDVNEKSENHKEAEEKEKA